MDEHRNKMPKDQEAFEVTLLDKSVRGKTRNNDKLEKTIIHTMLTWLKQHNIYYQDIEINAVIEWCETGQQLTPTLSEVAADWK
jgi:hypothetical protein